MPGEEGEGVSGKEARGVLSTGANFDYDNWTNKEVRAILRATMDRSGLKARDVLIGHLTITVPVLLATPVVLSWGLQQFGPQLWPYYVSGGLTIAWQWYSLALPHWLGLLRSEGMQGQQTEEVARSWGLIWPGTAAVGSFALHTTACAVCAIHFGPWLLSRWFAWIVPLTGMAHHAASGDDWFQHFELVSIVPALLVGYILSRKFRGMATWAWILPTVILAYDILTFSEPPSSVLAPNSSTRFSYFFAIQRSIPTLLGGGDFVRVSDQMDVVAPFYAGVAYAIGALAAKHYLLEKFFGHPRNVQPEPGDRAEKTV
jgi:hypothetical protein